MNAEALITALLGRGVRLERRGDRLHVEAPPGSLSDEERESLRACKAELLRLLDPMPPEPPPVLDDERGFAAAWRGAARELGEIAGYPEIAFRPERHVAPGAANWALFVTRASIPDLRLVVAALRQRLQSTPRPEDIA